MMNASDEAMRVQGSGVTDGTYDYIENAGRYRTRYSQKLFNAQVQDTITLDDKETLWLTPSIRYNWPGITAMNARMPLSTMKSSIPAMPGNMRPLPRPCPARHGRWR